MRAPGLAFAAFGLLACGADDASVPDTAVTTERCSYLPMSPTA